MRDHVGGELSIPQAQEMPSGRRSLDALDDRRKAARPGVRVIAGGPIIPPPHRMARQRDEVIRTPRRPAFRRRRARLSI
jgi:hypothetical protein